MRKKTLVLIMVTVYVLGVSIVNVGGQEYPTKPIEIISIMTPGSSMDALPRLVAAIAPKYLGKPMFVSNKPGAVGTVGAVDIVKSKPDGYKLITLTALFFALTLKTQKINFDPSQIVPIAAFMENRRALAVKADSPWKTLAELLDYGRKNPDTLRWCNGAPGSPLQTSPMLIFKKAGVKSIEIITKGSSETITSLLGGHVDAASTPYSVFKDHLRAGTIRFLVTYGSTRYSVLPNVPCVNELGFPDASKIAGTTGVFVHRDTPEKNKKILFDAFKKTFEDPEFQKGMENLGEEPKFGGAEFIREQIKITETVGIPLLKDLGLFVEKK